MLHLIALHIDLTAAALTSAWLRLSFFAISKSIGLCCAEMNYVAEQEASRTMEVAYQISQLLDTGLDKQTIGILVALCQNGVNPEASREPAEACI